MSRHTIKKNNGFTLIELLVVIAIIAILASIVLAALSTARNKGSDAAVEADLANARPQAELFYQANSNSYVGVCTPTNPVNGVNSIADMVQAAAQAGGVANVALDGTGAPGVALCNADETDGTAWAAEVPLKAGGYYCVDSIGNSKNETDPLPYAGTSDGSGVVCQ